MYSAVLVGALRQVWEASGELRGKRLAPFMAELVPALEAEGALTVEAPVREQLLASGQSSGYTRGGPRNRLAGAYRRS